MGWVSFTCFLGLLGAMNDTFLKEQCFTCIGVLHVFFSVDRFCLSDFWQVFEGFWFTFLIFLGSSTGFPRFSSDFL